MTAWTTGAGAEGAGRDPRRGRAGAALTRLAAVIGTATLGAVAVPAATVAQAVGEVGIPIGTVPDAVTIEDLDGNEVDLSTIMGTKPVLLEFWATWCELCEALIPELEEAYRLYGERVEFRAVSVAVNQTRRSIRRHLERHPVSFPVLWDTRGRATRAFQAPTTSYIAILDADGKVAYTGVGADQRIVEALAALLGS